MVRAAASIADELGDIEKLTLAMVAEHFGVRLPSLYNYVAGLAELKHALALLGTNELTAAMQGAAVGLAGDAALTAVAHAYRDFARRYPGRYAATLRAPDPADQALQAATEVQLALMLRILQPYQLSNTDAIHGLRMFRSILHGFVSLELAGGFGIKLDHDESFRRLVQTALLGLRSEQ